MYRVFLRLFNESPLFKKDKPRYCAIECVRHMKESHIDFFLSTICCVEIAEEKSVTDD